ncbi:MAG: YraN family protein [Dehalococcoidales bacterium]|nr:YraN family protein [Dehalococcoidales bacterium]
MKRKDIGALGERLAVAFLRKRGYAVIETNYRCPVGEIDIVACKDDAVVFVEVKTRTGDAFGSPQEAVTQDKAARLRELADYYLQTHDGLPPDWQINVVAIRLDGRGRVSHLEMIENAISG